MKDSVKNFVYNINYTFFMKNAIILESNPDFCDNTRALFDRMIELKLNEKFKLIWFVNDQEKFSDIRIKNVYFIGSKQLIRRFYYNFFAKYIIF